jgi:hypothetical protein
MNTTKMAIFAGQGGSAYTRIGSRYTPVTFSQITACQGPTKGPKKISSVIQGKTAR